MANAKKYKQSVSIKLDVAAEIRQAVEGGYCSFCPELDTFSQGETVQEAKEMLLEATLLTAEVYIEDGRLGEWLNRAPVYPDGEGTVGKPKKYKQSVSFKLDLSAEVTKEKEGMYYSTCPKLDVSSQGDTEQEAKDMLVEAILLMAEVHIEDGTLGDWLERRGI